MIELHWLGWLTGFLCTTVLIMWLHLIFFGDSPSEQDEGPFDERRELRKGDKL